MDILWTGWTGQIHTTEVYRNDGGTFTDINAGLPIVAHSSADYRVDLPESLNAAMWAELVAEARKRGQRTRSRVLILASPQAARRQAEPSSLAVEGDGKAMAKESRALRARPGGWGSWFDMGPIQ